MVKIVYTGPREFRDIAQEAAPGHEVVWTDATHDAVASALLDAGALVDASMRVKITGDMIRASASLSVVSCATTGSDHIDRQEAEQIRVITLRDSPELLQNLTPAAELTWALVLACARKLPAAVSHVRNGSWAREEFPGMMLNGRRLGVIGCGRIGGWVARYGAAFGMDVVGYDPQVTPRPPIRPASLEEVVASSDVVSIHVHLSDQTRDLVSRKLFQSMKRGAIFINTSRGGVADEVGLLEVLEDGRLSAAGLDVLNGEPEIADHPLRKYAMTHDNLLITPHCGGFSPDAVAVVVRHATAAAVSALAQAAPASAKRGAASKT
jgi:phosphoglycerate dehydrogenase-like enzyme